MEKRKENSNQNAVAELTREGLYKENKWLWEENKKLKEENGDLKAIIDHYKKFEEGKKKLKEVYIKNKAEFLDKKFPKINGFMEEDTLQELRDLGKI